MIWFSLNDTPGPLWPGHCGLFELDGIREAGVGRASPKLTGGTA